MLRFATRRGAVATLAGLALALLLSFPGLLGGERLLFRDTSIYFWPTREFLAQTLKAWELPAWLPSASCGQPFLANPKNAVLYPGSLLYLVLPFSAAFHLLVLGHLALLGMGVRAWLRRVVAAGRLESGFAAVALVCSGFVLSSVEFHVHVLALSWLPWVLLAAARAQRAPSFRGAVCLAGATAMLALAGEPYVGLITVGLVAVQTALLRPRSARDLARVVVGIGTGLALAAPMLVPAGLHLLATRRMGSAFGAVDSWALPPSRILELLLPNVYGPVDRIDRWGPLLWGEPPLFLAVYPGLGVVLAAIVALVVSRPSRRALVVGLGGVGMLLATTDAGRAVCSVLPLSLIRYRSKYVLLVELALTVGAAFGLGALRRRRQGAATALLVASAAVASGMALGLLAHGLWERPLLAFLHGVRGVSPEQTTAWIRADLLRALCLALVFAAVALVARRRGRLAAWLAGVAMVGDLLLQAGAVNRTFRPELAIERGPLVAALRSSGEQGRLWRDQDVGRGLVGPPGAGVLWSAQRDLETAFGLSAADVGVRYAFDVDYDRMYDIAGHVAWQAANSPETRVRLLRLAGVARVIAEPARAGDLRLLLSDPNTGVGLYTFPEPLPVLRSVGRARHVATTAERLAVALSSGFDPTVETVVEGTLDGSRAAGDTGGEILTVEARSASLTARVSGSTRHWLVWATTPSAGWRASLDGHAVELRRADALAMAVEVPGGAHTVRFDYRPPGLLAGCALAAATAMLLGALLVAGRRPQAGGRLHAVSDFPARTVAGLPILPPDS
jgi:hypothetical protein